MMFYNESMARPAESYDGARRRAQKKLSRFGSATPYATPRLASTCRPAKS